MATQLDDIFFIIECINLGVAIIFLCFFVWRLRKLNDLGISSKYQNVYPKQRIVLAVFYIVISIGLLTFNIIMNQFTNGLLYLIAGGGGQCINSLILILQLKILRQQIKRLRPYTCLHLVYSIYLVLISIVRFIITLNYLLSDIQVNFEKVDLTLTVFLMVDSTLLLGYWLVKRQQLPQFQEIKLFNMDKFKQNNAKFNKKLMKHHKIQYIQQNYDQNFPFIFPTVNIEKNKFRVTLEIIINPRNQENQQQIKNQKKSQVISQGLFTVEKLRQLYMFCGRFKMQNKVKFYDTNYIQLSMHMQTFLQELFANPHYYHNFVLKFFKVSRQIFEKFQKFKGKSSIYDDEQQPLSDLNAIFISVCLYKHLWIDDHYVFYMRACSDKQEHKSHPMKRYSDFQQFDYDLKLLLNQRKKDYELPHLPKKHSFYWDQQKIVKRRKQLEIYLRKVINDSNLMSLSQVRDRIFTFLHFKNVYDLNPRYKQSYYEDLKIKKGNIVKALIQDEDVTFYQFKLYNKNIQIGSIKKRFSQFVILHQDLNRWMNNIKITYKLIQLPEKHLFKSQLIRHEKLFQYLKNVILIKDAYKIYELGVFFNIASDKNLSDESSLGPVSILNTYKPSQRSISDNLNSPLRSPTKISLKQQQNYQIQNTNSPSLYPESQKMSQIIQDLGKNLDFQQEI